MYIAISLIVGLFFGAYIKYTNNFLLLIPFFLCFVFLYIFSKKKAFYSLITLIMFFFVANFSYSSDDKIEEKMIMIDKKETYSILMSKKNKYICYDLQDYEQYSVFIIEGETKKLEVGRSKMVSSFNDYLSKKGIGYSISVKKKEVLFKGDFVRTKISDYLSSSLSEESASMVKMLVLGNHNDESMFYDELIDLSVVHLFVISGFHLNILGIFINKILKKKEDNLLTLILLLPYCYLLNFSIPIMRAFLYKTIKFIGKIKKKDWSSINCLVITMLIFLFFNYRFIFNISFLLTFITNFVIVYFSAIKENKILKKYFMMPLVIYLCIIPIINNINYQISCFGFLFSTLLSLPVCIMFILSIITSIVKITDPILKIGCIFLKKIVNIGTNFNITLIMGKMSISFIFVFYLILFLFLYFRIIRHKKVYLMLFLSLFILLSFQYFKRYLFGQSQTIFIDVGQGDSTLIMGEHNKYNILIDTGGSKYTDIANKKIILLLKASGIRKLDCVFITHNDYDHNGALESLTKNFEVENVIQDSPYENFIFNNFCLENLNNNSNFKTDNERSCVFYYEQNGRKILIMGDASTKVEKEILSKKEITCDILRVGHHGSKTSSSIKFLENLDPKIAIISVGKNYYGHPSKEVLNNLNYLKIPVFRTDNCGNICINKKGIMQNY